MARFVQISENRDMNGTSVLMRRAVALSSSDSAGGPNSCRLNNDPHQRLTPAAV
jgi:hypothetical protein